MENTDPTPKQTPKKGGKWKLIVGVLVVVVVVGAVVWGAQSGLFQGRIFRFDTPVKTVEEVETGKEPVEIIKDESATISKDEIKPEVKSDFFTLSKKILSTNLLINGTNTLYGVEFTNDYNEAVSLQSVNFKLSGAFSADADGLSSFKMYRGSTNISDQVSIKLIAVADGGLSVDQDMENVTQSDFVDTGKSFDYTIQVEFDNSSTSKEVAAGSSEIYYLKATVGGINSSSDSVSINVDEVSWSKVEEIVKAYSINGSNLGVNAFSY